MKNNDYCHSFQPFVHKNSRILILGSMPGPMALRKQEYYGFTGNHFWTIIPTLLKKPKPNNYSEKLVLLQNHGIALWDVLESCIRPGAADSAIRDAVPNSIPKLLKNYPRIRAVFINGRLAHKIFMEHYKNKVQRPVFCLPSSSPANAMMSIKEKIKKWGVLLEFLGRGAGSRKKLSKSSFIGSRIR